jgi:hypothetical protein
MYWEVMGIHEVISGFTRRVFNIAFMETHSTHFITKTTSSAVFAVFTQKRH